MLMGYREYARHRGVTLGAVQKAIRAGRISVNENGKIDAAQADRDWDANTDASRVAVNVLASASPAMPPAPVQRSIELESAAYQAAPAAGEKPDGGEGDEVPGNDRAANEYREHRATRERYQAPRQQLEYEQLAGKLIDVTEAKRIVFTSFRALRDSMTNVAVRIRDQVAVESDPYACEQIIENEIAEALGRIDVNKLLSDQSDADE